MPFSCCSHRSLAFLWAFTQSVLIKGTDQHEDVCMPHPADPAPRGRPRTTDASPARWPSPTHTHRVTGPQPARTHTLGLGQKVRRFFETIGCDSEEKYSKTIGRRTENYTNMLVRERGRYYSASIFCAVDAKKLVHSCRSAAGFGDKLRSGVVRTRPVRHRRFRRRLQHSSAAWRLLQ